MPSPPQPGPPRPPLLPSRDLLTFLGGLLVPFGVYVSLSFGPRAGAWATFIALMLIVLGLGAHERHEDHSEQ